MNDIYEIDAGVSAAPPEAMMSVSRALAVLSLIATAPERGLRSSEIAVALDLHKASVSRLLSTLVTLEAITRDRTRRYRISERFRALFGVPASTTRLRAAARLALGILSDRLEDAAFLSVRAGLDSLCVERHIGSHPIQALSLSVGSRRPLGVGAGSMALIAWLDEDERNATIEMQRGRLDRYHLNTADIAARVTEARAQGFVDLPNFVIKGMTGMGVPIRDASGLVVAGLSVAAISDRLSGERRDLAVDTLKRSAAMIEEKLRTGEIEGPAPSFAGSSGRAQPIEGRTRRNVHEG